MLVGLRSVRAYGSASYLKFQTLKLLNERFVPKNLDNRKVWLALRLPDCSISWANNSEQQVEEN
jgi:hypothetical protein